MEMFYAWLEQWQTMISGGVGFAAAIAAVLITLRGEQRKAERQRDEDLRSLQRALGAEIRQFARRAFYAHDECCRLVELGRVNLEAMQGAVRFPRPVIYPAMADKLARLGDEAYLVVQFFGALAFVGETLDRWERQLTHPRLVDAIDIGDAAETILGACTDAVQVLPMLSVSEADRKNDEELAKLLETSKVLHDRMRQTAFSA